MGNRRVRWRSCCRGRGVSAAKQQRQHSPGLARSKSPFTNRVEFPGFHFLKVRCLPCHTDALRRVLDGRCRIDRRNGRCLRSTTAQDNRKAKRFCSFAKARSGIRLSIGTHQAAPNRLATRTFAIGSVAACPVPPGRSSTCMDLRKAQLPKRYRCCRFGFVSAVLLDYSGVPMGIRTPGTAVKKLVSG